MMLPMTRPTTPAIARLPALFALALLLMMAPSGARAAPGATCGGFIGNALCGAGEFCQHAAGACTDFLPGACTARTKVCTRIYLPVCGCDGKTYANDCVRASAGVSAARPGRCDRS